MIYCAAICIPLAILCPSVNYDVVSIILLIVYFILSMVKFSRFTKSSCERLLQNEKYHSRKYKILTGIFVIGAPASIYILAKLSFLVADMLNKEFVWKEFL